MPGFNISTGAGCDNADSRLNGQAIYNGSSNNIETARSHRFKLEILDPFGRSSEGGSIILNLEKCTRPTPEIDEIVLHSGQDEIYRPGKNRWNPVEFTFYERLRGAPSENSNGAESPTNSVAQNIYKWWGSTMINLQASSHKPVANYYKRAELSMKDGYGNDVWTYYLYDCWPVKVTPNTLDYSNTDIARITVTLRYNKAQEKKSTIGVGYQI